MTTTITLGNKTISHDMVTGDITVTFDSGRSATFNWSRSQSVASAVLVDGRYTGVSFYQGESDRFSGEFMYQVNFSDRPSTAFAVGYTMDAIGYAAANAILRADHPQPANLADLL